MFVFFCLRACVNSMLANQIFHPCFFVRKLQLPFLTRKLQFPFLPFALANQSFHPSFFLCLRANDLFQTHVTQFVMNCHLFPPSLPRPQGHRLVTTKPKPRRDRQHLQKAFTGHVSVTLGPTPRGEMQELLIRLITNQKCLNGIVVFQVEMTQFPTRPFVPWSLTEPHKLTKNHQAGHMLSDCCRPS